MDSTAREVAIKNGNLIRVAYVSNWDVAEPFFECAVEPFQPCQGPEVLPIPYAVFMRGYDDS